MTGFPRPAWGSWESGWRSSHGQILAQYVLLYGCLFSCCSYGRREWDDFCRLGQTVWELSEAHFQANGLARTIIVLSLWMSLSTSSMPSEKAWPMMWLFLIRQALPAKKQTFSVARTIWGWFPRVRDFKSGRVIIASTNAANVSRQKFTEQIDKGFAGRRYQVLNQYGLPADFAYNKKKMKAVITSRWLVWRLVDEINRFSNAKKFRRSARTGCH